MSGEHPHEHYRSGPYRLLHGKHGIASAREFLRRVVLFFLEARYLIYRKEVELDEDDLPEEEETDWEETMYSQYQKEISRFQHIIINH